MSAADESVILVDAQDRETGTAPKLLAHQEGLRHRAISVLVVDRAGRMLVHRRAAGKYHSGGLWTNACCSHPRPGEAPADAAARRLREEMGLSAPLAPLFVFAYRAPVGALIEDEIAHVFAGRSDGSVAPDPAEADAVDWLPLPEIEADMAARPERWTVWFRLYMRDRRERIEAWARAEARRER